MKFMITWRIHEAQRHDAFKGFCEMTEEEDQADHGDSIRVIGRWHDLAGFTGVAICESDDAAAVANWCLNWNAVLDVDVKMVLSEHWPLSTGRCGSSTRTSSVRTER